MEKPVVVKYKLVTIEENGGLDKVRIVRQRLQLFSGFRVVRLEQSEPRVFGVQRENPVLRPHKVSNCLGGSYAENEYRDRRKMDGFEYQRGEQKRDGKKRS